MNVVLPPTRISVESGLISTESTGTRLTTTSAVSLTPSAVAITPVVPAPTPVTTPTESTDAMAASAVAHVTSRPVSVPPTESYSATV